MRKVARNEWNTIDMTLTEALRHVSALAHSHGKISQQQKHKYFMSGIMYGLTLSSEPTGVGYPQNHGCISE